jgi:hypothetical protein
LFFWIIILAVLVPMGMRMYRRSMQQRNQGPGLPGQYPGQQHPNPPYPGQPYPNQPYPNQPGPGGAGAPSWQQGQVPYEDSAEYRANPPQPQQNPASTGSPSAPPPPSAPQGFRARKLAELDQQYSDGQISMEEYMARRNDIMNG